jgi:MFS superfamily sulfate permease-like transporter
MRAWLVRARNDTVGGLVSAAVAIPLAMGYGMFAFVALGDAYFAHGVLAGLYTAIIVGVVSVATGDRTTTLYAPRIVTTFFLGSLVFALAHSDAPIIRMGNVDHTLAVIFSIILVGGAFQALFGLLRLGTLIRHTPQPVMAGFQNAAALLLFLVQLGNVLGYGTHTSLGQIVPNLGSAKPLSVAVALVTMVVMWHARRVTASIPSLLVGLLAGTAAYHALAFVGFASRLGPVIGPTPAATLGPWNLRAFAALVEEPRFTDILPVIVTGGLGLAIIASIDALLCTQLLSRPGDPRPEGNRQLARLGLGNMVAASSGGITSGVNLGPSVINRACGAQTSMSVVVNAGAVLATTVLLLPVLAYVPRAVLSAVIMVVAIQHVDPSTIQLVRRLAARRVANRASLTLDLFVIALVATLSIVLNIVLAVFVGLGIAIVLFIVRMSGSLIRRTYRADTVPSRRQRSEHERAMLAEHGRGIHVLELQGALFFGTVERLADAIGRAVADGARFVILDLGRVTDVDITGGRLLSQTHADFATRGHHLLLTSLNEHSHWGRMLRDLNVTTPDTGDRPFPDSDRAIEWAEDQILAVTSVGDAVPDTFAVEDLEVFRGLTEAELATLRPMLEARRYTTGDVVIAEGATESELFLIIRGSASVHLREPEGHTTRLASFSSGTVLGELALLDHAPRSATVLADGELACFVLTEAAFRELKASHPAIAMSLVGNLAREVSGRLRRATQTIRHLAS